MTFDVPYVVRPIDAWPGAMTQERRASPFSASWTRTQRLLDDELRHLDAHDVILQVAVTDADLRLDGRLRANARPAHPGIILAFDSAHGPLKYASDRFLDWRDNLRAIALGLEALRKVDRYGITRRGEQYTGWRALPAAGESGAAFSSRLAAWDYLVHVAGASEADSIASVVRRAMMMAHPDRGGDDATFQRVLAARKMVERTGGG